VGGEEAGGGVVVEEADGLHEGVADGGADEFEAAFFEVFAHLFGNGDGVAFFGGGGGSWERLPVDEAPDIFIEGGEFELGVEEGARVLDHGIDFEAVANDARIFEEGFPFSGVVFEDFVGVELIEGFAVVVAFFEDGEPAKAGLGPFEVEHFEEEAVVVDGNAPLGVVIGEEGVEGGPVTTGFFRHEGIVIQRLKKL
jgi:hypothetical protein